MWGRTVSTLIDPKATSPKYLLTYPGDYWIVAIIMCPVSTIKDWNLLLHHGLHQPKACSDRIDNKWQFCGRKVLGKYLCANHRAYELLSSHQSIDYIWILKSATKNEFKILILYHAKRKPFPTSMSWRGSPMFSTNFRVSGFTFRSLVDFELISEYG